MHRISKSFECDYGHRVWSQKLNIEYSLDDCLVCRHLHGHRMTVTVELEAEELEDGMVTDFKHLNWFKLFIDEVIDHKFIIDGSDPLFKEITGVNFEDTQKFIYDTDLVEYKYIPLVFEEPIMNELRESFVIVDFVPTSENLAEWFFKICTAKMEPLGVKVSKVSFKETPKSLSEYTNG